MIDLRCLSFHVLSPLPGMTKHQIVWFKNGEGEIVFVPERDSLLSKRVCKSRDLCSLFLGIISGLVNVAVYKVNYTRTDQVAEEVSFTGLD